MNWEKTYAELSNLVHNGKKLNSKGFINKIKLLNEWHRVMYVDYFNSFISEDKLTTINTYKYHILNFLLNPNVNSKPFYYISQLDIDNFLETVLNNKTNYFKTVQYSLISYIDFYSNQLSFTPKFLSFMPGENNPTNKKLPLTCSEVEEIRNIIKNEQYLRFIFEFAYENKVRFENSRLYSKSNYDDENGRFIQPNGEFIMLSDKLRSIIEKIKDSDEFISPRYKQGFSKSKLYQALQNNNFHRPIKSIDVNATFEESTSFKCPECGNIYEAIASNWIVKQFYEDGEFWIVCREKCGEIK